MGGAAVLIWQTWSSHRLGEPVAAEPEGEAVLYGPLDFPFMVEWLPQPVSVRPNQQWCVRPAGWSLMTLLSKGLKVIKGQQFQYDKVSW
jgi:hypothetical protein